MKTVLARIPVRKLASALSLAALTTLFCAKASAQTATWNGVAGDGLWNTAGNWDIGVPAEGTNAVIGSGVTANYTTPMVATSFNTLTNNGGIVNVNTNGFVLTGGGSAAIFNTTSSSFRIGAGGVVSNAAGGMTFTTNSFGTLAADGSLSLGGNLTVGILGNSSTGGGQGFFTNNGGTLTVGGVIVNNSGNNQSCRMVINGGTNNLGAAQVKRSNLGSFTTIGPEGLLIFGGVNSSTSIDVGAGGANNWLTMAFTGGTLTNTGAFTVQQVTASRASRFVQTGGLFSSEATSVNLRGHASANVIVIYSITGGTNLVGGFAIGNTAGTDTTGTLRFTNAAKIYIGSGGFTNFGTLNSRTISLNSGGVFGARADWSGNQPMLMAGGSFDAADLDGTPHNITLTGVLSGTGGAMTKTGGGTLSLLATNTYSGNTTISAGTLTLGASGMVASPVVSVATGATLSAGLSTAFSAGTAQVSLADGSYLDVSGAAGFNLNSGKTIAGSGTVVGSVTNQSGSALSPGNTMGVLTFSNGLAQVGGVANNFDLSATTNDTIEVVGDLTVSGANSVSITAVGGSLPAGTYKLFHYTGAFTGGVGVFTLSTPGYLTNIVAAQTISLVTPGIRGATNLVWVGHGVVNDWDIGNHTNWLNGASLDSFFQGDTVLFNATGAANPVVNVTASVNPGPVTVDAAASYTFTGPGVIGGTNGIVKTNTGTLTILSTNSYTGATIVGKGALEVSSLANGGVNSAIGAAPNAAANLVFEGTTLRYLSGTASTDRGSTLNGSGVTLDVTNSATALTLNGATTGAGALTKAGSGVLVLGVANGHTGGTVISNGTLQINNATSFGPAGFTNAGATLKFGSGFTASQVVEFNNNCTLDLNSVSADATLRGAWSGTGTVLLTNLGNAARTFTIGGDGNGGGTMSAFTGTLNGGNCTCDVRFNDGAQKNYGSAGAVFDLGTGGVRLLNRNGGVTIDLGALKGGSSTRLAGRASGSSGTLTYSIGALNLDTIFDGTIVDFNNAAALTKVGSGKLTLTGASTYTGATIVSDGTLQVNGSLASPTVTVNGGTLAGTGTIGGSVTVNSGATISPGASAGTLTVNNTVTLASGSTTSMEIDSGNATNDRLTSSSTLTYGGTLNVTNLSGALTNGSTFKIFNAANEFSYLSAFDGGTNLPALGAGLAWDTTGLATNGTLSVYSTFTVNLTPTNIVSSVSGGNLTMSWPSNHIGWTLQTQTNTRSVGLKVPTNNWFDVAGSSATNSVTLPVSTANPTVFFRLFYPVP